MRPGHWNVSLYPLRGPAGQVTHVLTFMIDVSDQAGTRARTKDAQQRVLTGLGGIGRHLSERRDGEAFCAELTEMLADLVPAASAAVWLYDPDTRTISPQPGAFGFEPAELERLRGIPCHPDGHGVLERIVFHDQVVDEHVDGIWAHRDLYGSAIHGLGLVDTLSVAWRAGEHRLGMVAVYGSKRASGFSEEDAWVLQAAASAAAFVRDHRQADDALAALRAREAASLRQQAEQSIELERLKTDFLKLASHELRGPLGVVRGYLSMMEDGTLAPVGPCVEPVLPLLRAKVDEMNQLINEMLDTARLEDSALQLRLTRVDLREVVQEAVRTLAPLAEGHHRFVTEASGPVVVVADRSRLSMIVTNLVHNAMKYSPGGGDVVIACEAAGARAWLSVSDRGLGIAPDHLDRLFTRFGRIVTPETAGISGTGLGLYLARDLARRHGGDVEVVSEPGRGSTFTLTLPLAPEPTDGQA